LGDADQSAIDQAQPDLGHIRATRLPQINVPVVLQALHLHIERSGTRRPGISDIAHAQHQGMIPRPGPATRHLVVGRIDVPVGVRAAGINLQQDQFGAEPGGRILGADLLRHTPEFLGIGDEGRKIFEAFCIVLRHNGYCPKQIANQLPAAYGRRQTL
jgi:hypothetical protein